MTGSTDFNFVVDTNGVQEQISATIMVETGNVIVTDAQIMPIDDVVIMPVPLPIVSVDPQEPVVTDIVSVINTQSPIVSGNVQVISVNNQPNAIGNTYTVTVQNDEGNEYIATVEQGTVDQQLIVVDVRPTVEV